MIRDIDINDPEFELARVQIPEGFLYISDSGMCFVPKARREKSEYLDKELFDSFLKIYNSKMDRNARGDKATIEHFKARVKEGYTLEDFAKAIDAMRLDPNHRDANFRYSTTEFILRDNILNRYISTTPQRRDSSYEDLKK